MEPVFKEGKNVGKLIRNISPAFHWYMQRITAMILVVGLFVHFWVLHFAIERPVTFEKVQDRLLSPGWVFFDVILLIAVIYHAFNGLYNVISDYNPRPALQKIIAWTLIFVGVIIVIYGILALLPFTRQGGV